MIREQIPISKSSSLDSSLEKMNCSIELLDIDLIFTKELNPIDNCYWINLSYKNASNLLYSNGKGTSYKAAKASAFGEFIERLQTNNFFSEFYLPNNKIYPDQKLFNLGDKVLDKKLEKIYNIDNQLQNVDLIDFNSSYSNKIVSLPFINLSDNKEYYIPLNILHNLYVSNGLASGNSALEAKIQALSEIYERYVKIEVIKNGYSLPLFPNSVISKFPKLMQDVNALEDKGFIVNIHDASLGGKFPVTAISVINPKNSTIFVSFGAHPILEASLQRTMTELMQGRSLEEMNDFKRATFNSSLVCAQSNLESHFINSNGQINFSFLELKKSFNYCDWVYNKNSQEDEYNYLLDIANNLNREIYVREYDYLGFNSVQVIIPNFSEIYPIDDLIYNNTNSGKLIRDYVLNFQNLNEEQLQDALDVIEHIDEDIDIGNYIGIVFKKSFTIKEFKAQLHLLLGNYEEVAYLLEDSSNLVYYIVSQLSLLYYKEKEFDLYKNSFNSIFTKDRLNLAIDIFNRNSNLIDISYSEVYIDIINLYSKIDILKEKRYI